MKEVPFTIKDIYKNPNAYRVNFEFYRKGYLHYSLTAYLQPTVFVYEFRVPTSDTGDAAFNKTDKVTLFRRYIEAEINNATLRYVTEWPHSVDGFAIGNSNNLAD